MNGKPLTIHKNTKDQRESKRIRHTLINDAKQLLTRRMGQDDTNND